MKSFEENITELGLAQRKARGRRMSMMSKKASTQKKKQRK